MNHVTLLIIEHQEDALEVVKLKNSIVVNNINDALKILQEGKVSIDCIITDIELKNENGINIIKKIREYYDGILIVIVYAANYADGVASMQAGADDFLLHCDLNKERILNIINLCVSKRKFKKNLKIALNTADSIH